MIPRLGNLIGSILLLAFLLMGAGCTANRIELPMQREMSPLPQGPICRIAVLPLYNDTDFPQGDVILQKIFMAELRSAGDYQVLQEGDISKVYQQMLIYPGHAPTLEQMKIIADRVNAQLLVTGTVMEMREDPGPYSTVIPKIVLELHIRDGRDGETLWTVYHSRQGSDYTKTMHFGTIHSIAGLGQQMAVEIINLLFNKGLAPCSVQFRP